MVKTVITGNLLWCERKSNILKKHYYKIKHTVSQHCFHDHAAHSESKINLYHNFIVTLLHNLLRTKYMITGIKKSINPLNSEIIT